jgi:hypothetical protein
VKLNPGEDLLFSGVIDSSAGYAYFGTWTSPGQVVKVALGGYGIPPSRVGAVTLNSGEDGLLSAVIDPSAGYAWFGTITKTGRVVKVSLGTGTNPPVRVGAVTLNSDEGGLLSAVYDSTTGYGYFGTNTKPGQVVCVGLSQKGFVKATQFNMPEDGFVNSVHFYSHESTGKVRLGIYDDSSPKSLLWKSGEIPNQGANYFMPLQINAGTPSSLHLSAGTYWLTWQVDTTRNVPSYTKGNQGDGFFVPHKFTTLPAKLYNSEITTTDEVWSQYITYTPGGPPVTTESIRNYLLGRIAKQDGMDKNSDGRVNIADLIYLILND